MPIRIQPDDIEIPVSDPFQHDKLNRKQNVEVLAHIIQNISGPCTIAIDAPWGEGKTTFLRLCRQHMQNEGFPVVSFNAWETDYSDDPFIALSEELSTALAKYGTGDLQSKLQALGKSTLEIVKHSIPPLVRVATAGVLDISPAFEQLIGNTVASYAEHRLSTYRAMNDAVVEFRSNFQDIADTLAEAKNRPLVVIIDELDRCRPSYAVELLEAAKHLFAVNHVVFILAINRRQLAHSICAIYGSKFNANEYLSRFFNIDYRLPNSGTHMFIASLLTDSSLPSHVGALLNNNGQRVLMETLRIFQFFFTGGHVSKRSIAQAIQHFNLALLSSDRVVPDCATIAVALVIRTIDIDLYFEFLNAETSDIKVAETIFDTVGKNPLDDPFAGQLFESTLISAHQEITGNLKSELHGKYSKLYESSIVPPNNGGKITPSGSYASDVLRQSEYMAGRSFFREASQRLELTSSFLVVDG